MSQETRTRVISSNPRGVNKETTNTIRMQVEVVLRCIDEDDSDAHFDESDLAGDIESALTGALNVFFDVKSVRVTS